MADHTKSKYQSLMAERLHTRFDPEEECGSVQELGWAGLYKSGQLGGAILREDSLGFVSIDIYKNDGDLFLAWEDMKQDLEASPEPEHGDIIIETKGSRYIVHGLDADLSNLTEWDDLILEIADLCDAGQFWPNVWTQSDHGNVSLIEDFADQVLHLRGG